MLLNWVIELWVVALPRAMGVDCTAMAGPAAYALAELLKEPFGPYWEDAALTKAAPNTTPKNPLPLRCVILESGGLYTGYVLVQTEAGFVILCALCAS